MSGRCEGCRWWEPNTVAHVSGWCSVDGIQKGIAEKLLPPVRYLKLCKIYTDTCSYHTPKESPHA
jgi:hypothetical protein